MSYTNFQTVGRIAYTYRLEIDFGSGFVNISDNLENVGIVETPTEKICGLTQKNITLNLRLRESEINNNWTKINTPIRLYVSANSFEELVFDGFTVSGVINENLVKLEVLENSYRKLHRQFGSFASDNWTFTSFGNTYFNDGQFLPTGDNEEGGTVADTNYRPKPIAFPVDNRQNTSCYLMFNKNANNEPGIYTIDQILKAMGCFGGFNKEGVFKLKKRVWTNPSHQWDYTNYPLNGTFRNLTYNNDVNFNSIDVEGYQFSHNLNRNLYLEAELGVKSKEILNYEVSNGATNFFLENDVFENIFIGEDIEANRPRALLNLTATVTDDEGSSIVNTVFTSDIAYDFSPVFNGTSNIGTAGSFNLTNFDTLTIMMWLRPEEPFTANGFIFSNQNASNQGQGLRAEVNNRRIGFTNHGTESFATNSNFFNWDEMFHLTIRIDQNNQIFRFYKNGIFANQINYTSPFNSSNANFIFGRIGNSSAGFYRGRIQEFRAYNSLLSDETIKQTYNRAIVEGQSFGSSVFDGIVRYWKFNEASGTTVNSFVTGVGDITLNFSILPVFPLPRFERLRKWDSTTLAFLSSFGADNFTQTINFTAFSNQKAFIKRMFLNSKGVYKKINDIKASATDFDPATELERKTELKSFYINDFDYAQDLADNLLFVYNNGLGFYSFKIPFQPRLMVGDIILFSTPNGDKKGVILEKTTSLAKDGFLDNLNVKVLSNL